MAVGVVEFGVRPVWRGGGGKREGGGWRCAQYKRQYVKNQGQGLLPQRLKAIARANTRHVSRRLCVSARQALLFVCARVCVCVFICVFVCGWVFACVRACVRVGLSKRVQARGCLKMSVCERACVHARGWTYRYDQALSA